MAEVYFITTVSQYVHNEGTYWCTRRNGNKIRKYHFFFSWRYNPHSGLYFTAL